MILYIVGDIHGNKSWLRIYEEYRKDPSKKKAFIFLGDLIDPVMPDGMPQEEKNIIQVIDPEVLNNLHYVRDTILYDTNSYLCLGNHDTARILNKPTNVNDKNYYNRLKNNEKYRVAILRMQSAYRKMIKKAPNRVGIYFQFDDILVSHAGISYLGKSLKDMRRDNKSLNATLSKYNTYDISPMWTRGVHDRALPGFTQVVGHTPYTQYAPTFPAVIQTRSGDNVIYIDDSNNNNIRGIRIKSTDKQCKDMRVI